MDSMLRDGLCVVGGLYLLLHLYRSIGSIRQGIQSLIEPVARLGSRHSRHILAPDDHVAVGPRRASQEELSPGSLTVSEPSR
jgi:hypothetical protein